MELMKGDIIPQRSGMISRAQVFSLPVTTDTRHRPSFNSVEPDSAQTTSLSLVKTSRDDKYIRLPRLETSNNRDRPASDRSDRSDRGLTSSGNQDVFSRLTRRTSEPCPNITPRKGSRYHNPTKRNSLRSRKSIERFHKKNGIKTRAAILKIPTLILDSDEYSGVNSIIGRDRVQSGLNLPVTDCKRSFGDSSIFQTGFQSSILDVDYASELDAILDGDYRQKLPGNPGFELKSKTTFFSKWTLSGQRNDKVLLRPLGRMSEGKDTSSPEFVQYIKERDAALEEARQAQAELRETQSKLYDSILLIEKLEKKIADTDAKGKSGSKSNTGASSTGAKKTPATGTGSGASNKKLGTGKSNGSLTVKGTASSGSSRSVSPGCTGTPRADGLYHPPIVKLEPIVDSRDYYWKLSEKFPSLTMFIVIDAEKKFMKADIDNNGYIDMDELDKVLSDTVSMFTHKQLEEIMKEIDQDDSNTLDFFEVLTVINKLVLRKKTNLPTTMQQNYTKTCSVQ